MVFQCINIRQVPREVLKTAASGLCFQHSLGTWRMFMHEKPCLIPIKLFLQPIKLREMRIKMMSWNYEYMATDQQNMIIIHHENMPILI